MSAGEKKGGGDRPAEDKRRSGRTGPVSKEGREISSRNALKHGLGAKLAGMPSYAAPIAALAGLLAREGKAQEAALELAEALLEVGRVRAARHRMMLAGAANKCAALPPPIYDRYERRALSRRRRLVRDLER